MTIIECKLNMPNELLVKLIQASESDAVSLEVTIVRLLKERMQKK